MTHKTFLKYAQQWGVAFLLGTTMAVSSASEQEQGVKSSPAHDWSVAQSRITYKPFLSDTPQAKVSRSISGKDKEVVILQVLAPDHVGLTTQIQPILYWYERTPVAVRFELTQMKEGETAVLLKVESDCKKVAGIQQLDLGDHNISLQPGVVYQWSVTTVMDESSQSKGVHAIGNIERIELGEGLTSRIERSRGIDLVKVFANEGIWYDALGTVSSMIDKSPDDKSLAAVRASLLEQVGLRAAAGN